MPLTPQEVASKVFGPTRMRRGYDENEVDAFLDAVEAELTRLNAENDRLRAELKLAGRAVPDADLADEPPAAKAAPVVAVAPAVAPEPAPAATLEKAAPTEPVEQQVTRMLILAQQTADAAISEAQSDADRTRGAARIEAERVLSEARARAAEEIGIMERSKGSLETQIEQLQTFEREYRQRLRAYLAMQLSELDGESLSAPAVESGNAHVLDVADAGEPAAESSHESHDGESHDSASGDGEANGYGSAPAADSGEQADAHSMAGGLLDPPGFGAVWSPESSDPQPGLEPFISRPRDPEGQGSYTSSSFDLGGGGLSSGGFGPVS